MCACRLEQQLAKRRARLAELKTNMEEERERQSSTDPEGLKLLARSQVSWGGVLDIPGEGRGGWSPPYSCTNKWYNLRQG